MLGFSLSEIQQYLELQAVIEQQKSDYHSTEDRAARRLKLIDISKILQDELTMIDNKLARMAQFKDELIEYENRVLNAIDRLEE